jgi:DNA-binding protein H-NS
LYGLAPAFHGIYPMGEANARVRVFVTKNTEINMIDIKTIPTSELRDLLALIPVELKKREKSEKAELLEKLRAQAKAGGFSLEELLEGTPAEKTKEKAPVAIKYKDASGNTWTGRGRAPNWLTAIEKAGGNRADYLIS